MVFMIKNELLQEASERLKITPDQAAAFVGLESYWDIKDYTDEDATLTVIMLLRLCALNRVAPDVLLVNDSLPPNPRSFEVPINQYGYRSITSALAQMCGDLTGKGDMIGWDEGMLKSWMSNDLKFGDMPLPALELICEYIQIDYLAVLTAFWQVLGLP